MKTKKEFVIIAILAVVLIAYLSLRKTDRTEYTLPAIAPLAADDITKIEMDGPNGTIVLEKRENAWRLMPIDRPADAAKVGTLTQALAKLELTALVSESGNLERYDLTPEKRIRVRAWAKTELKRDVDLGKTAPTYQHTFVKLPDSPRVYHARTNLRSQFEGKADDFRNKAVFAFQQADVTRISLTMDGKTQVFTRETVPAAEKDKPAQVVWKSGEKSADHQKIDQILTSLATLRCEKFFEPGHTLPPGKPILEVAIEGKAPETLQVFDRAQPSDATYPATATGQQDAFTVPGWKIDQWKKDWAGL
ncbi:DUF4340 domain-containing protein [Desulfatirhabdium butyrativorans]|uniref:DUF4340 domain-containing protein n=1 Tax=Desulfatirhabdium butyrativorans TaxID=340467 RepID=UPI0003FCF72A|nr:DUF4340 domain-containing protein [Desulfatirhabdium butyrativorans]